MKLNLNQMPQYNENLFNVAVGFCMATTNHAYGWFNNILQVNGIQSNEWLSALLTGSIGAMGAYVTNKGIKYIEKKIKNKSNEKDK